MMFSKILVANRGEIALRVIRACREMGIPTVAVYSEADGRSLHLALADERVCIGPAISRQSYLNIGAVLAAAEQTGAAAIHPGYGYLAENPLFASACADAGITFIGPTPENLRLAGDKIAAKKMMQQAGVPVIPSSPDRVDSIDDGLALGEAMGYPVMIKAAGGGGGRGIRICPDAAALGEELPVAGMEAGAAFGDDRVYLEKWVANPRHIEFQILADAHGNVTHLGERECTIQRRFQKLIEEAPSTRLTPEMRKKMGAAAETAARVFGYLNAGTVEFLVDADGNAYFMEMNARIQVEHPVTEVVTGVDLVKEQIRIAAGHRLTFGYDDLPRNGWAIECRINAEDPDRNFLPSPGTVDVYRPPGGRGVRLDTHLYQGYELPIYYDSMVAKLIAFDRTRPGAIQIMKRALAEFTIAPLKTTIPLHLRILEDDRFVAGAFDTGFIRSFVPDDNNHR